jgi:histidinol-phosphatase (PHP family)
MKSAVIKPPDYHMHTPLCGHASGTPEEYVEAAVRAGIKTVCFTDHAPAPDNYDPENRMTLDKWPDYLAMVRKAADSAPITVLTGTEADYYEPVSDFLARWLPEQPLDYVLGSVHYLQDWGVDDPACQVKWETSDLEDVWRKYYSLIGKLADTGLFDAIGHLDLPKKFGHRPPAESIPGIVGPALDRIKAAGMAIELNTSGLRRPCREIYPSLTILKMAREKNIPITFGSDAHTPTDVGSCFDQAVALARSAGYTSRVEYRKRRASSVPL